MKSVQCVRCHRLALPLLMFAVRSAALVLATLAVIAPSAGADELEPVQEIPGQLVGLSDDGEVLAVLEIDSSAACVLLHVYQRGKQLWGLTQSVVVPTPLRTWCTPALAVPAALSGDGGRVAVLHWSSMNLVVFGATPQGWLYEQTIELPLPARSGFDPWPAEVALADDGTVALVSTSPHDICTEPDCVLAYSLSREPSGWILEQQIKPPTGQRGYRVAVSGDGQRALITGTDQQVYSYARGRGGWWTAGSILAEPEPSYANPMFGDALALRDDGVVALVGEPYDFCAEQSWCGSAHVYAHDDNTWQRTEKLLSPFLTVDHQKFGDSIALAGHGARALIGAPDAPCGTCQTGVVHVLKLTEGSWQRTQSLQDPNAVEFQHFGRRVALSADGYVAAVQSSDYEGVHMYVDACAEAVGPLILAHCLEVPEMTEVPGFILPGCAVVDCCPGCPGDELINWLISFEGDQVQAVVLRFENLPETAQRQVELPSGANWIGPGLLRLPGDSVSLLRALPRPGPDLRWSSRSPRMTIHQIITGPARGADRRPAVRLRVEQRIGRTEIGEQTLMFPSP
jgi:hypothetical protein